MKQLSIILLCLLQCCSAYAQGEGNIWAIADGHGISFNATPPTNFVTAIPLMQDDIDAGRCASVCDAQGHLLFYTNGLQVWNRNNQQMPNGQIADTLFYDIDAFFGGDPSILGGGDVTITSVPGEPGKYYIFASTALDVINPVYINYSCHYSIVDMNLDNGLGDIVPGKKGINFGGGACSLAAVAGNNCDIWVVTAPIDYLQSTPSSFAYTAFHVTEEGVAISPPVVSNVWSTNTLSYVQQMRFTPNGEKLAAAGYYGVGLCDFNKTTGELSNDIRMASLLTTPASGGIGPALFYSVCFSPDGTKLYAGATAEPDGANGLFQFDISLPDTTAIENSQLIIWNSGNWDLGTYITLKCGPDGQVYFSNWSVDYGGTFVVPFPNTAGTTVVNTAPVYPYTALPDLPSDNVILPIDTAIAAASSCIALTADTLILQAPPGSKYCNWSTGDTGCNHTVSAPGIYYVTYLTSCTFDTSKFTIVGPPHTSPAACTGKNYIWAPYVPGAGNIFNYTWTNAVTGALLRQQLNSNSDTLKGLSAGAYQLTVSSPGGCSLSFTIYVQPLPVPDVSFTVDPVACLGQPLTFSSNDTQATAWQWNLGDNSTATTATTQHTYADTGSYNVTLLVSDSGCTNISSKNVVIKDFHLQLVADTVAYFDSLLVLQTTAAEAYSITEWQPQWLFPDQTASQQNLIADSSRQYVVVGESNYGCLDSASIQVNVIHVIPNTTIFLPTAFTPNGDGVNDYFHPRYKGDPIQVYFFQVYDRWGQLIFDGTGETAEKGWDGTFQGKPVDIGVYFYTLQVQTTTGKTIDQKGDVTLLR